MEQKKHLRLTTPQLCLSYLDALKLFKGSLYGGSERIQIANQLQAFCSKLRFSGKHASVKALDIGTGDGSFIAKIMRDCVGTRIKTMGLDPSPLAADAFRRNMPGHKSIQSRFEELDFDRIYNAFDIVLSIQSLYYLERPRDALSKILRLLRQDGMFVMSLWSEQCALYRLHKMVFQHRSMPALTAETVQQWLKADYASYNVSCISFKGGVDFSTWRRQATVFDAALIVLSRDWGDQIAPTDEDRSRLRQFLNGETSFCEQRVNKVLTIRAKSATK